MNSGNIHDQIQAYLDGTLSEEDRLSFEEQLKTNKALKQDLQLHQEVDRSIDKPKALEMEVLLQDIGGEFAAKYTTSRKPKIVPMGAKRRSLPIYKWAIAASFALLISFLWWQFGTNMSPINAQDLYANAYEPYAISTNIRSIDDATSTVFQEGQKKYQLGEYQSAITLFSSALAADSLAREDAIALHFYKGVAHLGNGELDLAQQELETALATSNHIYVQQTYWYLALIALKNDDLTTAKARLNQTISTAATGKYNVKAKELLKKLE